MIWCQKTEIHICSCLLIKSNRLYVKCLIKLKLNVLVGQTFQGWIHFEMMYLSKLPNVLFGQNL